MPTSPTSPAPADESGRRADPDAPQPTRAQSLASIKEKIRAQLPVDVDAHGRALDGKGPGW